MELAEVRRSQALQLKKQTAEEMSHRSKVLQRKNDLEIQMSDIIDFISNSENVWDILSNDNDWEQLIEDGILLEMVQKDAFEIEKMLLKKDAERLNEMLRITHDGDLVIFTDTTLYKPVNDSISEDENKEDLHLHRRK